MASISAFPERRLRPPPRRSAQPATSPAGTATSRSHPFICSSTTAGSTLPVLLTLAEFDPPFLVSSTLAMAQALTERDGVCPPLTWLRGHNHVSPVLGLGGPGDRLGDAIHGALLESV